MRLGSGIVGVKLTLTLIMGCVGDFDPATRTVCSSQSDCLAGWVCDTSVGRCVSGTLLPGDDTAAPQDTLRTDDTVPSADAVEPADTLPPEDALGGDISQEDIDAGAAEDVLLEADLQQPEDTKTDGDVGCETGCVEGQAYCVAGGQIAICESAEPCPVLGPALECDFAITCAACDVPPCPAQNACGLGAACVQAGVEDESGCRSCAGGRLEPANQGLKCHVGDLCVTATCQSGACEAGGAVVCGDGNPCTTDICEKSAGCAFVPKDGSSCDLDVTACTPDYCVGTTCTGAPKIVCDDLDGNVCTREQCDPASGACDGAPDLPTGEPCDDGKPCTGPDTCSAGSCSGTALDCDDGDPCTNDTCDATAGCTSTSNTGNPCDDGDACTADACVAGTCVGTAVAGCCEVVADCPQGALCASPTCVAGECGFAAAPDGQPCDPGGCLEAGSCKGGACEGATPMVCPDLGPCFAPGVCDPVTGACSATPAGEGVPCSSASGCLTGGTCDGSGKCGGGVPSAGWCVIEGQCVEGGATAPHDSCLRCEPTKTAVEWTSLGDGEPCDDGDTCTIDDRCDQGACGATSIAQDGLPCADDGQPCTLDVCTLGTCLHPPGNPGVLCRGAAGSCDIPEFCSGNGVGCPADQSIPAGSACDPGDPCSTASRCTATSCTLCAVFKDDFSDMTLAPWTLQGALASVVKDPVYGAVLQKTIGNEVSGDAVIAALKRPAVDLEVWATIRRVANEGSLSLAMADHAGDGFVLRIRSSNVMTLQVTNDFNPNGSLASTPFVPQLAQWYTFRLRRSGLTVSAELRVGQVDYEAPGEPTLALSWTAGVGTPVTPFTRVALTGGVTLQLDDVVVYGDGCVHESCLPMAPSSP